MNRIRVLIVEDSRTMQGLIAAVLRRDPQIEVVGQAGDAVAARDAVNRLSPDVITLDIEMPGMGGLDFLKRLMRARPTPVVMVSARTGAGAAASLEALASGAVDCVAKPSAEELISGFADLVDKVKAAATAKVGRPRPRVVCGPRRTFQPNGLMVAIGASAGGVEALETILAQFPEACPPTVIAQHMMPTFTHGFAQRLDRLCAARVVEATDGARLAPGLILVAPGGFHMQIVGAGEARWCRILPSDFAPIPRPSIDILFNSIARAGAGAVGVLLSGIGRDGAEGLAAMRRAGGRTLGQDQATSTIYGMARAAAELGAVEKEAPLDDLASEILELCNAERSLHAARS